MKRFLAGLQIVLLSVALMAVATWSGYQLYRLVAPMTLESWLDQTLEQQGLRAIPDPAGKVLREHLQALRPELKQKLEAFRAERKKLIALLKADTLDKPAIEAQFARIRALSNEMQGDYQQSVLEGLAALSPQDRRAAIKAFEAHCEGDSC